MTHLFDELRQQTGAGPHISQWPVAGSLTRCAQPATRCLFFQTQPLAGLGLLQAAVIVQ
jgi:hypothetical protein